MILKQKRCLSLLEVAIGLALTTILLTSVFSTFRHIIQANLQVQTVRGHLHERSITHLRLMSAFSQIKLTPKTKCFYTDKKGALTFFYDNGIDRDKDFCGEVEANLFLDGKTLKLITKVNDDKSREDILMQFVDDYDLQFFDTEEKTWVTKWNENRFPDFVKLTANQIEYIFKLNS